MMRAILGEDFEFGRDDGGFLSMAVLSDCGYYRCLKSPTATASLATQAFLEMFGTTLTTTSCTSGSRSLGTGKTVALTGRAQRLEGPHVGGQQRSAA
jgi:hypothetical protein